MLNDLLTHQKEEVEIQKVLLVYCLKIDDIKIAGPIVAKVVSALDRKTAENNADIRKVLLLVSDRYKSGENFELRPEIQHNGTTENHYKP